ncbi:MAG: hypothetical protein COA96_07345 [SAR86 cluster bacterium]|uniref:FAD dependent oxidoreductase domain-containing protein n=1 Tax=SAR86 cluster bacterium TaxID=2030880 RepID=A0A2A5B1R1_9GAMM|nr:MAG: hypothetical protein COA96_07345 [SAR86 cluster bacterium]
MTSSYSTDIVIFGGGIAGLWLLNRLRDKGYRTILLETNTLGSGQTLASQGIIHGGLKYALNGTLTGAANVIAGMPAYWRSCLNGTGEVDLTTCKVLSDHYYMWSEAGIRSKLKTFLGSKSLQGRVEPVPKGEYPSFFKAATVAGTLYKLPDFVVDTSSLLQALTKKYHDYIFKIDSHAYAFERNNAGQVNAVTVANSEQTFRIEMQNIIFSAGEGNQELINKAELKAPKSQVRPLKMVFLKQENLPRIFVHCIGSGFSLTPKLTVTSHTDSDGCTVWYLGGELAESGVGLNDAEQINAAKILLGSVFPWIDLSSAQWQCFTINRAEANINNDYRPEDAYIKEEDNILVAWPTKLTLTPSLADKVIQHLVEKSLVPMAVTNNEELSSVLEAANIGSANWD